MQKRLHAILTKLTSYALFGTGLPFASYPACTSCDVNSRNAPNVYAADPLSHAIVFCPNDICLRDIFGRYSL